MDDYNTMEKRAAELSLHGIGIADAFHTANAEFVGASLITCDDMLIKRCGRCNLGIWVGTPIDFCKREGLI